MTDECLELKNIKYKTMLLNGNNKQFNHTKSEKMAEIDRFLEKERKMNRAEPWGKLDQTQKIRKIEQLGYTISLASGRTLPNVTPIQQSLAVSGFVVGENGGMVWDTHAGFPIRALADGERAREAANWLASQIEGLDPAGIESNRWRETEWCLKEVDNYEAIREAIAGSQYNELSIVPTGFAIHICTPGLDKSTGVEFALEQRGIDPSRVIAVGDAANDIPMFELCGFAVAVNNEHDGVVESSDIITEQNGTSGTIEFLKQFIQAVEIP